MHTLVRAIWYHCEKQDSRGRGRALWVFYCCITDNRKVSGLKIPIYYFIYSVGQKFGHYIDSGPLVKVSPSWNQDAYRAVFSSEVQGHSKLIQVVGQIQILVGGRTEVPVFMLVDSQGLLSVSKSCPQVLAMSLTGI